MKLTVFLPLSVKYLWRYKRRYLFLFLALGFGFAVVTVVSSLKDGIENNLNLSARSHYAGDITAIGYETESSNNHHMTKAEKDAILEAAAALDPASLVVRTTLQGMKEGTVFFNGNAVALKYVVGVDWQKEADYFNLLSYTETPDTPGAPDTPGGDSILLSSPIAGELGARQGDSVILEVLTASGQKNTGTFTVSGIVDDSSFFGYYKVYLSGLTLNRLIGFADEDCSLVGFFLKDRKNIEKKRELLYTTLKNRIQTGPLVYDRNAFNEETNRVNGSAVFLVTLPVYLSEVAQLLDALDLAALVLEVMMAAIIMVSAAVTCRLILHERVRETGTMRVIGFYESDLRLVIQVEIMIMALCSMAAGFVLALAINQVLSFTSFTWVPGFEIFLQSGRLNALYLPGTVAFNVLFLCCMLILTVWGPIFRNSRNPLPEMLSGGVL